MDAGSVVCFNSKVQLQRRDDDSIEWYKFYDKVMTDIGWRVQSSELFSEYLAFPDVCKICEFNNAELEEKSMMVVKDTFDSHLFTPQIHIQIFLLFLCALACRSKKPLFRGT